MPKKKSETDYQPTMTPTEITIRISEAKVRLTEAKALGEGVKAKQAQIELDKSCGELVYVSTAMDEFNKALVPVMAILRTLPQTLALEAKLTPTQHAKCSDIVNKALEELSEVSFEFETASEVEERAREAHTAKSKGGKR